MACSEVNPRVGFGLGGDREGVRWSRRWWMEAGGGSRRWRRGEVEDGSKKVKPIPRVII